MTEILLPRVAGYRGLATVLVETAELQPEDQVTLDGRGLVASTDSFASQMAKELFTRHVSKIMVLGGSPEWLKSIGTAAETAGLAIEVKTLSSL